MKYLYFYLLLILTFNACNRFDSNAYNDKIVQGSWALTSIYNKETSQSLINDKKSILKFESDTCTEYFSESVDIQKKYQFKINNYRLLLTDPQKKSQNSFLIYKLIKDSLILENDSYLFKYTPIQIKVLERTE